MQKNQIAVAGVIKVDEVTSLIHFKFQTIATDLSSRSGGFRPDRPVVTGGVLKVDGNGVAVFSRKFGCTAGRQRSNEGGERLRSVARRLAI